MAKSSFETSGEIEAFAITLAKHYWESAPSVRRNARLQWPGWVHLEENFQKRWIAVAERAIKYIEGGENEI